MPISPPDLMIKSYNLEVKNEEFPEFVSLEGFEPSTSSLRGNCSTVELQAQVQNFRLRELCKYEPILAKNDTACILSIFVMIPSTGKLLVTLLPFLSLKNNERVYIPVFSGKEALNIIKPSLVGSVFGNE